MSQEIPLAVPYKLKDHFKEKYGAAFRWNPQEKHWYWKSPEPLPDDLKPYFTAQVPPPATGNSSPRLILDLIPHTCWFSNVRNHLEKEDWDKVRKKVFQYAYNVCEVCRGKGRKWPVECHEVFEYDEERKTQKLVRLVALCPTCHQVKHFGKAQMDGKEDEALAHLCKVNGWTRIQGRKYVNEQFDIYYRRSEIEWQLDLSYLTEHYGVPVKEESSSQRRGRADAYYSQRQKELFDGEAAPVGPHAEGDYRNYKDLPPLRAAVPPPASGQEMKRMLGWIRPFGIFRKYLGLEIRRKKLKAQTV